MLGVLSAVAVYGVLLLQRPSRAPFTAELAPGVLLERRLLSDGVPQVVNIIEVDLSQGVQLVTTNPIPTGDRATAGQTTSDFVRVQGLVAGVNAGFFDPCFTHSPWDSYPEIGDPVDVNGQAIHDGEIWAWGSKQLPVVCARPGHASIVQGRCPEGTQEATAGSHLLVDRGAPAIPCSTGPREPRTAIGVSKDGATAWLVVVDGRQPFYSEGASLFELASILADLGVWRAINLDGGGSTALATRESDGAIRLRNAPIHTRIPMRERPVATHIGVRAARE